MGKSLEGKELGKGITQLKDGYYQARFVDRFGHRRTIRAKSKRECTLKLRDAQYEDDKGLNSQDSKITLDEWFEIWMGSCKTNCRNTSLAVYRDQYNRIRNELGCFALKDLNFAVIQSAINHLKSNNSRKTVKTLLCSMLNSAVDAELINKNVAKNVIAVSSREKKERRVLTRDEIDALYNYTEGTDLHPLLVIALETGMRIGEITGLTWDDVDFNDKMIHVRKTLVRITKTQNHVCEFHSPKSAAGVRDIPMTRHVMNSLIKQRSWRDKVNKEHAPLDGFENLVFLTRSNRPIYDNDLCRRLDSLVKHMNEDNPNLDFERFTPHCLRHTFATHCIAGGMKPKVLQKIMGHSSIQMTMDLYAHVLEGAARDEMSRLMEMA